MQDEPPQNTITETEQSNKQVNYRGKQTKLYLWSTQMDGEAKSGLNSQVHSCDKPGSKQVLFPRLVIFKLSAHIYTPLMLVLHLSSTLWTSVGCKQ